VQAQELALRSASAADTKARRMKLQDNVHAVVVKEVQLRDPVLTGALHCCSRASPITSSPTFNCPHCPASGDHPPTSTRPPPTRTAIRAAAARRPTDYGARARRPQPQRGHHRQGHCDPSGAPLVAQRTMGPGPGLVARVLWLCYMRLASSGVGGVRPVRLAFGRHPMHPPRT